MFDEKIKKEQRKYDKLVRAFLKSIQKKKEKVKEDTKTEKAKPKAGCNLFQCCAKKKEKDATEELTADQLKSQILIAAKENYKIFSSVWPDEERIFFWHLLAFTEQAVIRSLMP